MFKILNAVRKHIFILLLLVINFVVYYPALYHWPRSDHWNYLLNTSGVDNFFRLFIDFYSYNRAILYAPCDVLVFRPLGITLLSLEKTFFGLNFFYWQFTAIVLHLLLICLLYSFVAKLTKSDLIAFCAAAFISFLQGGFEVVIWHHISFYILALIYIVVLSATLRDVVGQKAVSTKNGLILVIFSLLLPFTYEIGVFFVAALILVLFFVRKYIPVGRALVQLAFLLIIYFAVNGLDYYFRLPYINAVSSLLPESGKILSSLNLVFLLKSLFGVLRLIFGWFFIPLFPAIFEQFASHRVYVMFDISRDNIFPIIANIFVFMILVFLYVRSVSFVAIKRNWHVFFISALTLFSLGFMVYVGRVVQRGNAYIFTFNGYYYYIAWVIIIMMLACAVDHERYALIGHRVKYYSSLFFTIFLFFCAVRIYQINCNYNIIFAPHNRWRSAVNDFISEHKGENDFTFSFAKNSLLDIRLNGDFLECDTPWHGCAFVKKKVRSSNIIFYPYCTFDGKSSKYLVTYDINAGTISAVLNDSFTGNGEQ